MRIVAGQHRSRKLTGPPEGARTRPIPDRVKESLFNLLRGNTQGAAVLDAFAGTGSIGLEAISRGASRCVFVERDKRMAELLRRNIATLREEDRCEVFVGDALGPGALSRCPRPVDLAFFDPPYELVRDPAGWERVRRQFGRVAGLLSDGGFAVLRTPWPFVHAEGGAPQEAREQPHKRKGRGGRRSGGRAKGEAPRHVEITLDDADLDESDVEKLFEEMFGPAATRPELVDAVLSIPGAEGPETHKYGTMAVHLYMREKEGAA